MLGGGVGGDVENVVPGNEAGTSNVANRVCDGDGRQARGGRGGKLSREHQWRENREKIEKIAAVVASMRR